MIGKTTMSQSYLEPIVLKLNDNHKVFRKNRRLSRFLLAFFYL